MMSALRPSHLFLGVLVVGLVIVGFVRRSGTAPAVPSGNESTADGTEQLEEINPENFDRSTIIDNVWWPLKPGTRWVYEGYTVQDGERVRHMVVDTVTDLTKEVNGVKTLVNLEEDYSDGQLIEQELVFHAQDNDGNVWHLGQLVEEYEETAFIGAHAWLVGHLPGAKAGIKMLAKPQLGASYSQGYAPPPFRWTDRSRVSQMGQTTETAAGNYQDVMIIDEWDAETPTGVFQTKYYARGTGVVRVGYKGDDPDQEEMELVTVQQLSPAALAEARAQALKIEERAYMYSRTTPAEQTRD
jgi:hypothetical protein